jgi:hypothetical protein
MDLAQIWYKHSKIILIVAANVVGLIIVLIGAKLVYSAAVMPDVPDVATASPGEIVDFLADKHVNTVSYERRKDVLEQLVERTRENPRERTALLDEMDKLSDGQISQLQENMEDVFKQEVVDDSKAYAQLPSNEKKAFVRNSIKKMKELQGVLRGTDVSVGGGVSGSSVDVARRERLTAGMPSNPAQVYSTVMQRTNPTERAYMESYVLDVQEELDRERAQRTLESRMRANTR